MVNDWVLPMMEKGIMRVLIADDSTIVRERLSAMLSKISEAESISYAEDVPKAISSIHKLNPEVVILDIRMPGGSGIDVLREIKRNNQTPIVIVLTNYPYPQYRRKYVDAGANFFFNKSTEFDKVTEVLKQLKQNQSGQ